MLLNTKELQNLELEVSKFNRLRTSGDYDKYLESRGALNSRGEVRPQMYEQVTDEIQQYRKWLGKRQYAERQRLKQLEEFSF